MARRSSASAAASSNPTASTNSGTRNQATSSQANATRSRQNGARGSGSPVMSDHIGNTDAPSLQLPTSQLPSIRFVPYKDPRSTRPSLAFSTITRTLPNSSSTIRVGRYSEKDSAPDPLTANAVSDAPVGFKSKVVSRRHCEFLYVDNQWHIKDVRSSSGTFLNHIRLSPPGEESKPYPIKDGDLIQLGIDFKGGEEMIFRCVKIRILCNRGWQKSVNTFNKSAHKHLNNLHRGTNKDFKESTECTICLNSIAPCQSLFVAPCSHTWHYKCIRPMLEEVNKTPKAFAQFLCPNCRALADLDADVDEGPLWEEDFPDDEVDNAQPEASSSTVPEAELRQSTPPPENLSATFDSLSLSDVFQHPSFGLPPVSAVISGLNPSASSFVPTSSSALPIPYSPSMASSGSPHGPPILPSLGPEGLVLNRSSHLFNGERSDTPTPASVARLRQVSSQETASTPFPETPSDVDDEDGIHQLDHTAAISPAISSRYGSPRGEVEALNIGAAQNDTTEVEGPLTPRNHAGPFVFDGATSPISSRPDGLPVNDEPGEPLSLNQAAVA